jgi:hypothetical protein
MTTNLYGSGDNFDLVTSHVPHRIEVDLQRSLTRVKNRTVVMNQAMVQQAMVMVL